MQGYGNIIILKHPNDFLTIYAHNMVNLVNVGELVKQRQVIAKIGQSGNATVSHLHFEIRYLNKTIDPLEYLP